MVEYADFEASHADAIMRICRDEGWPSLSTDRALTIRALTAPGVIAVVALEDGEVVGFVLVLSNGEETAYLSTLAVARGRRGSGVGRGLIAAAFERCDAPRMDLLSLPGSTGFYERLPHQEFRGFRLYR
ncbi:MAG: GNAT family N-acetyltransferase [Dehalococcoidia bacterium]|nr:GNAT family N-acetyltransferase [Dehalococcoidia bacterium]